MSSERPSHNPPPSAVPPSTPPPIVHQKNYEDETDWDLEERDRYMAEHPEEADDPTVVVLAEDE